MGAESFMYYVPFQPDAAAALTALQQEGFLEALTLPGWPSEWPRPRTYEEFRRLMDETNSYPGGILELDNRLIGPGGEDEYRAVRMLGLAEVRMHFGTDRPTRADFERVYAARQTCHGHDGPYGSPTPCPPGCAHELDVAFRDAGRCTVLYDHAGQPEQIVFWGRSGD